MNSPSIISAFPPLSTAKSDAPEYERVSPVPGTSMLTYCPGRKANSARLVMSMLNQTVLTDMRVEGRQGTRISGGLGLGYVGGTRDLKHQV